MNYEEILNTVKATLSETLINIDPVELQETSSLKDEVGLDSMSSLTFLLDLENKLNFTVDPTSLDTSDFETIGSISKYISHQVGI